MDSRHTVYGKSVMDIDMGHMHSLILVNDLYCRIFVFSRHPHIQLLNVRNQLGNYLFQILQGPFFKGFRQDGVVGVCAGLAHYRNGLIHAKRLFLHQDTNQLRDHHGRMGIVDLDHRMFIHFTEVIFLFFHFTQDKLCRIRYHKILLVDAQKVPRFIRIIRVQKQRQVLLHRFLVKIDPFLHKALIQ